MTSVVLAINYMLFPGSPFFIISSVPDSFLLVLGHLPCKCQPKKFISKMSLDFGDNRGPISQMGLMLQHQYIPTYIQF